MLIIDQQNDFCQPEGTLFVAGHSGDAAIQDSKRIAEFLYRNIDVLSNVEATLDTHFGYQIFSPSFWLDQNDQHPDPHTIVTTDTIDKGEFRPNPAVANFICKGNYSWLQKQCRFYTEQLEKAGKYQLYLWPGHCILGSTGHALVGVIQEATMFHGFVRGIQPGRVIKGGNPLTENYSVLSPEVIERFDNKPLAQRNVGFIEQLLHSDAVIICGEASSHCVKSTIEDLLDAINQQDPELAKKVYIMKDCMSSVVVPGVMDFTPQADAALQRFEAAGMHVVESTSDIGNWNGINL
jgi:nicotinamidase-related amidase